MKGIKIEWDNKDSSVMSELWFWVIIEACGWEGAQDIEK